MKINWTPSGGLSHFPSDDKGFFKKKPNYIGVFEIPILVPQLQIIKGKPVKWTPSGMRLHLLPKDKEFRDIKKGIS